MMETASRLESRAPRVLRGVAAYSGLLRSMSVSVLLTLETDSAPRSEHGRTHKNDVTEESLRNSAASTHSQRLSGIHVHYMNTGSHQYATTRNGPHNTPHHLLERTISPTETQTMTPFTPSLFTHISEGHHFINEITQPQAFPI